LCSRDAAFLAHGGCGRIDAPFLWRRLTVLDFPARDIDNELCCLAEIARALGRLRHIGRLDNV
jgi:hypothetical protein